MFFFFYSQTRIRHSRVTRVLRLFTIDGESPCFYTRNHRDVMLPREFVARYLQKYDWLFRKSELKWKNLWIFAIFSILIDLAEINYLWFLFRLSRMPFISRVSMASDFTSDSWTKSSLDARSLTDGNASSRLSDSITKKIKKWEQKNSTISIKTKWTRRWILQMINLLFQEQLTRSILPQHFAAKIKKDFRDIFKFIEEHKKPPPKGRRRKWVLHFFWDEILMREPKKNDWYFFFNLIEICHSLVTLNLFGELIKQKRFDALIFE